MTRPRAGEARQEHAESECGIAFTRSNIRDHATKSAWLLHVVLGAFRRRACRRKNLVTSRYAAESRSLPMVGGATEALGSNCARGGDDGGPGQNRTGDTRIFSAVLDQLSYRATGRAILGDAPEGV